jgi:molybdopterin synthase sulfur carrier subunit
LIIKVRFFTSLREITGKKIQEIQCERDITIEDLLSRLADQYGKEFRECLYDEKGSVHRYFSILVNGQSINRLEGLETKLKEKDIVVILPPVGGGALIPEFFCLFSNVLCRNYIESVKIVSLIILYAEM